MHTSTEKGRKTTKTTTKTKTKGANYFINKDDGQCVSLADQHRAQVLELAAGIALQCSLVP
jgi:ribosomal protein S4E